LKHSRLLFSLYLSMELQQNKQTMQYSKLLKYKKCNCIITIGSISITYGCKIVEFICAYFSWTS
jgi:hypothetical protein